jgi:putative membrane protein
MPSEQRLHPVSILFLFGRSLKAFAVPGLLVLFTTSRSSGGAEFWMMLLLIPSAFVAVARYLSFRLRYEGHELVIRSGIVFRNERHVPYARIQNLDAVQNVFHRLLGVMDVRVETGAGKEPEATISVLPAAAFEEMRRHVFERRMQAVAAADADEEAGAPVARSAEARTLLRLSFPELLLFGFLENRGLVVIGAMYGLLWELGLLDAVWSPVFDDESYGQGMVRDALGTIASGRTLSLVQIVVALAGIIGLLIVVRLVSMCWAVVRLSGFRLSRVGEDLRTEFGLFTRVTATIPLRRIQTMTVREGPLSRLVKRSSVRVETAGGGPTREGATSARELIAPLIRPAELQPLVQEILPELDMSAIVWRRPHPRAFRRAVKPRLFLAAVISGVAALLVGGWALGVFAVAAPWAIMAARQYVEHLGWATTDDVVVFRSGWLWRSLTVARVPKIQAVTLIETPFDRRNSMARVRVDTAGAGERSHRVDIPYLSREIAGSLQLRLAAEAAGTAFRW